MNNCPIRKCPWGATLNIQNLSLSWWFAFSLIEEDVFELKKKIGEVLDAK